MGVGVGVGNAVGTGLTKGAIYRRKVQAKYVVKLDRILNLSTYIPIMPVGRKGGTKGMGETWW